VIPNADQIEKWSTHTDDGYVKIPSSSWPELLWVLRKAEEVENGSMAQRAFLLSQPCEGMFDDSMKERMQENGWACIDIVPSNTSHMCLRCRVLLYMDWAHGFPKPRATA
jgi:hypothetical protein